LAQPLPTHAIAGQAMGVGGLPVVGGLGGTHPVPVPPEPPCSGKQTSGEPAGDGAMPQPRSFVHSVASVTPVQGSDGWAGQLQMQGAHVVLAGQAAQSQAQPPPLGGVGAVPVDPVLLPVLPVVLVVVPTQPGPPSSQLHTQGAQSALGGHAGHAQAHAPPEPVPPLPPPEQSHSTGLQSALGGQATGLTHAQSVPEASRGWQKPFSLQVAPMGHSERIAAQAQAVLALQPAWSSEKHGLSEMHAPLVLERSGNIPGSPLLPGLATGWSGVLATQRHLLAPAQVAWFVFGVHGSLDR
jgi:hypothetical protein